MLEILGASASGGDAGTGFTFRGIVTGPSWTDIVTAMGIAGGTRKSGSTYLSFLEKDTGFEWLLATDQILFNCPYDNIKSKGGWTGKQVTVGSDAYFVRAPKLVTGVSFTASDIPEGGTVSSYAANSVFANSELNRMIYPLLSPTVLGRTMSTEGIKFGTQGNYNPNDIGFTGSSTTGGAMIGSEENANGWHILVNNTIDRTRYCRKGESTSHGWRPMIRKVQG